MISKNYRMSMSECYFAIQNILEFPGIIKALQPHMNDKNHLMGNFHYSAKFKRLNDYCTLKLSADDIM